MQTVKIRKGDTFTRSGGGICYVYRNGATVAAVTHVGTVRTLVVSSTRYQTEQDITREQFLAFCTFAGVTVEEDTTPEKPKVVVKYRESDEWHHWGASPQSDVILCRNGFRITYFGRDGKVNTQGEGVIANLYNNRDAISRERALELLRQWGFDPQLEPDAIDLSKCWVAKAADSGLLVWFPTESEARAWASRWNGVAYSIHPITLGGAS